MSGKLDRRRARARRIQRAIFHLHGRGLSVEEIAQRAGVSVKRVERTLDNLLPASSQTQPSQQERTRIIEMDTSKIRTEKDLLAHLEAQQQRLEELQQELDEKRAESATRRLALAEERIEALASQGMSYEQAFVQVVDQLEETELQVKAEVDKERRARVQLEYESLSEEQAKLLVEAEED